MFELTTDCYAIVSYQGKNKLLLVSKSGKENITGFLEDDLKKDDTVRPIKVPYNNVLASLGPDPKIGSAFGVKIEPFIISEEHSILGTLHFYKKVTKKDKGYLYKCLDRVCAKLDKKGLLTFVPVDVEIRNNTGKQLGYYKSTKKEEVRSILCLQPPALDLEPADLDYIVYHEALHGVWYTAVSAKLRAKWIKLFERRIKCKVIKQKELDSILDELYKYDGPLRDMMKDELGDHELDVVKEALKYLKKVFRLDISEVDILMKTDGGLDKYWPTQQDISRIFPDLSLYSLKNVQEFFAEAGAFYFGKQELPKDVTELLEETFEVIKNR